ncbi:MAG TPA: hypothetical protein VK501_08700 [Baekduia sp.]|uniref:hypothetical protein n=1 Tax=Baekduia sp. TaxID=2600305 RepID=UPI002C799FA8|nr:hypothetical protein [Baekduia sp.]HMJ33984.1 hypothetical protein [Baekduia sp.]
MNLVRHFEVLKRGRAILALGLLVAITLAVLATWRVSFNGGPKLTYRKAEVWAASTKLLITQPGFPWGRSVLPGSITAPDASTADGSGVPTDDKGRRLQFADPSRLAYLAWIYSHFLMGDEVRTMLSFKPEGMDIQASPLTAGGNMSASALPIIGLTTRATSASDVQRLNDGVRLALEDYLTQQQRRSGTPTTDRVVVSVVDRPGPMLEKGHSINLGIVAFLLVMSATVGVLYLLENLRLQRRQAPPEEIWGDSEATLAGERRINAQQEFADARLHAGGPALGEQRSVR